LAKKKEKEGPGYKFSSERVKKKKRKIEDQGTRGRAGELLLGFEESFNFILWSWKRRVSLF